MSSWKAPETVTISRLRMRAMTLSSSVRSHAPGMLFPLLTLEFWSISQTLLSSGGTGPWILGPCLWEERKPFRLLFWDLSPLFANLQSTPFTHVNSLWNSWWNLKEWELGFYFCLYDVHQNGEHSKTLQSIHKRKNVQFWSSSKKKFSTVCVCVCVFTELKRTKIFPLGFWHTDD